MGGLCALAIGFVVYPVLAQLAEPYPFQAICDLVEKFARDNGFAATCSLILWGVPRPISGFLSWISIPTKLPMLSSPTDWSPSFESCWVATRTLEIE